MSAPVSRSQPSIEDRLRYLARLDYDEENFGSIPPTLLTEAADRIEFLEGQVDGLSESFSSLAEIAGIIPALKADNEQLRKALEAAEAALRDLNNDRRISIGTTHRKRIAALLNLTTAWPVGCHDPDSCARHSACMYIQCARHGRDENEVAVEIRAALSPSTPEVTG